MSVLKGTYRFLFLDRDGVINERIPGEYVHRWEDFVILDGVLEALKQANRWFDKIFIVTNQAGVGKGLMTHDQLHEIHRKLLETVTQAGGKIDQIYYCPELDGPDNICRKPAPGMAIQARKEFPDVRFHESIMVGDSQSDIDFGHQLGMLPIGITTNAEVTLENCWKQFPSLLDFINSEY